VSALLRGLVIGPLRNSLGRALVTVVAVALGVAIGLAIDLANATAVASFASSVNVISSHVDLQVLGIGRGFDERAIVAVRRVSGVRYAGPATEDAMELDAKAGDPFSGETLRVLGVDTLEPLPGLQPTPGSPRDAVDPALLVDGRGAIVSTDLAERHHWHRGSPIHALAGDRAVTLVLAGLVPRGTPGIDTSVVFVDIATAQELFAKVGLLDRIDLVVDPAHIDAVRDAVSHVVPPGARVVRPTTRTGEIARMLSSFRLNLEALAYVALLVGMFLIYNAVAISVAQRRPEIGTARAIGATRAAVFGAFVVEGAGLGVIGSLAGLVLGGVLANASVAAVSRTVDTIYIGTHADHVTFDPLLFVKAFVLGVAASIVAAALPAIDAASTPPAIAMRARGYERPRRRLGGRAALAGIVAFAAALALTRLPALDGVPVFGYASGLCIILGGSLFAPLLIELLSRAGRAAGGRRPALTLAAANLGGAPLRNAVAVASLAIAIGMMVSVSVLVASFRTTVVAWADETLRADLFVRPLGLADASADGRFSSDVPARLRAVPGVAAIDTFRGIMVPYEGRLTNLAAVDLGLIQSHNHLRLLDGAPPTTLARMLPNSESVLISEPFANRFGAHAGTVLHLPTNEGTRAFTVAAIYNDYSSDAGVVLIDERTYRRLYHDDAVNSIAVYAQPGVDLERLRSALVRRALPRAIDVESNRSLRQLVVQIFDRTFAITYALDVVAVTIAVLGVISTLFALVLERKREYGLLRYLGATRRRVRDIVVVEAAFIGVLGGGLGLAVGMALALLLVFVINRQAFGWLIELHVPWAFLGETFALVIVAALLAGLVPARVAARIQTADAVRAE
jgi:putative ABC transport system permease protein